MIALGISALVGLALGAWAGHNLGWDRAVEHYRGEAHAAADARAERDRRGSSWWGWVAVGGFVAAMLVLGVAAR